METRKHWSHTRPGWTLAFLFAVGASLFAFSPSAQVRAAERAKSAPATASTHDTLGSRLIGLPPLPPPPIPPLPIPLPLPPLDLLSLGPPALPRIPSLPQVFPPDAPTQSGSVQLPVTGARLEAKLLILSADGKEPVLGALRQAADYIGVPYTLYVATQSPGGFTPAFLSDGGQQAKFQGILMTTGTLGTFDGTSWHSALSPAEWQALWDYQAKYKVRTAVAYALPTADLGFGPATGVDASTTPVAGRLTPSGRAVFPYVNAANEIPIRNAWTYLAAPAGSGTDVLLADAQGHALSLVKTYPDGRQVMSMTFDGNFFLVHSLVFGHGLVNWVAGGLFLGERQVHIAPQVDDIFLDNDIYGGGIYRQTATDWTAVVAWQTLRQQDPQTSELLLHMAFNGEGASGKYPLDTLTPTAQLTQAQFPWINHTYTHENLDALSYAAVRDEIERNNAKAAALGLTDYDRRALVTPDVSGLANPAAMQAAYDAGVRFLVTDTSRPGMDNPTPQTGLWNPHAPGILMVPRRPVNLYYNVSTPQQWTDEYNQIYRTFWGRDLSYTEILDKESDVLLQYMLRGELDPWMFHQANLRAYDGVRTLLGDLLDRLLAKFSRLCVLPVRSLTHVQLGERMHERMKYNAAGVRAWIAPDQRVITLTAAQAAKVPVTGLCAGESSENYGGQCISWIDVAAGQSVTFGFDGSPSAQLDVGATPNNGAALAPRRVTASPNPFRPSTEIAFATSRPGRVTAQILDVTGRLVRTLADEEFAPGTHSLPWNGTADDGKSVAAGVYFVKLRSPDGDASTRVVRWQ